MSAADDRPPPSSADYGRRLVIELVVLAVLSVITVTVMWQPWHAPSITDYDRVRDGMTRAEVERLLGPPGDYRSWATRVEFTPPKAPSTSSVSWWVTDDGVILVRYVDDKVAESGCKKAWIDSGVIDAIHRRLYWFFKYGFGPGPIR
jgi:hypothetical protein